MDDPVEPIALRQQVASLPADVLAAWRTRYVAADGVDLQARALLGAEAAEMRAEGQQPDARTVWLRLIDQMLRLAEPRPDWSRLRRLPGWRAACDRKASSRPVQPRRLAHSWIRRRRL